MSRVFCYELSLLVNFSSLLSWLAAKCEGVTIRLFIMQRGGWRMMDHHNCQRCVNGRGQDIDTPRAATLRYQVLHVREVRYRVPSPC